MSDQDDPDVDDLEADQDVDEPESKDGEDVEPAGPDDADGPDLDDDDFVEVDEEMAAAVADATSDSSSSETEEDDSETDESNDSDDSSGSTDPFTTGTSVGDLYCNALGMGATMARDKKGSGVDDRQGQMDEYGDLARQLELDQFVDEWFESYGGADELTPAQGIAIATSMFAVAVLADDPAIAENLQTEDLT